MEMETVQNVSYESDQMKVCKSNICEPTNQRNETHMVRVFEVLKSLRNDEVLCDIRLQTDDGTIVFGHKVVLVSASPYFRAMLTRFDESKQDLVNIRDLDSTALQLLVDYVYTGEIMVTEHNVQVLLPAANLLQFDFVRGACSEFLLTQLNPSNCIGVKAFAELFNCVELLSSCDQYIKKQFLEVVKYEEFLSLSTEEVIKIISSNDLAVPFEEKVYECVINWVRHELDGRYDSLPKLLEHVRIPLISIEYIISEKVFEEPLLKNSSKCIWYVVEAFNFLKTQRLKTIPQTICTTPRRFGQVIIVFSSTDANWYDPATNLWHVAPESCKNCDDGPMALIKEHFVFCVGGDCVFTRSVKMLDLSLQSPCWVSTVGMFDKRASLGVGVFNDCLYAIGGYNDNGALNSAEVFDIRIQKWRMVSCLSTKRYDLGVGVLNNCLYAVGGEDYNNLALKSVECYDPCLDTWSPVSEMSECRVRPGVGVLYGIMYAVGGSNGSGYLKSVEAYRPSTGVWYSIANMHMCRSNPGVFALEGLLYVFGGDIDLDFMEMYNPNTNTWSMEPLSKKLENITGGVVVDCPSHFRTN